MTRHHLTMLGVLLLGFGVAGMGACGGPVSPNQTTPPDTPPECPATIETPCKRYRIELVGDLMNVVVRNKYIAAFGDACYVSEAGTFDCWYKTWEKACEDAAKIGAVSGNAPYDPGYKCQPVGNGDYTLQIGSDVANITRIYFADAPRQTPLIEINGVPTEVNGPYRNLVEVTSIEPGKDFNDNSGMVDADGGLLKQREWVLAVNRKNHSDNKVHSDLAGFMFPCEDGKPEMCPEPDVLGEPSWYRDAEPQVHHVVPVSDKRCCPWGTNTYRNAAVISRKLNRYFTNNNPPVEEVLRLNNAKAYTP